MEPPEDVVTSTNEYSESFAGSRRNKAQSIRRRKFTLVELEKRSAEAKPKLESQMEGPFWFEKSTTSFQENEKLHHGITRREHQLLRELVKSNFYTPERLRTVVVPLNDESSHTPRLRAFDWAVTNFAKGKPQLQIVNNTIIDPNLDYQNELKKHHRLLFDPFRRGTHLFFELEPLKKPLDSYEPIGEVIPKEEPEVHRTTVGQLCFIKWCIDHHVDKYVEDNLDQIRTHMSITTKKHGAQKRRKELTSAPKKMLRGAVFESMIIN